MAVANFFAAKINIICRLDFSKSGYFYGRKISMTKGNSKLRQRNIFMGTILNPGSIAILGLFRSPSLLIRIYPQVYRSPTQRV